MSYAIESKKRKFDRVLESLTDAASKQSNVAASTHNNGSASSIALNEGTADGSKRRRITPSSLINSLRISSNPSLTTQYLPASRQAFLERLETYRQITKWRIPSTEAINAAVWAKRGWICVETDTVFCGSCKERLTVDLDLETPGSNGSEAHEHDSEDEDTTATDMYDALIKRYLQMTITAHTESCLWRKRGSDSSIQRIEGLLNAGNAIAGLKTRYNSMLTEIDETPPVEPFQETHEAQLAKFVFDDSKSLNLDLLRLAICGWRRKDVDVLDCQHCFRSLGLWLYRGNLPAMEKLDAVESHLEYCPWRSQEAQDTELTLTKQTESGPESEKVQLPGWELVSMAITKTNMKKEAAGMEGAKVSSGVPGTSQTVELSPEQREKRMKDLMRRIKELKKPFNMKGLLRKNKSKA